MTTTELIKAMRVAIREEVKQAVQDSIKDILVEAVSIASAPEKKVSHIGNRPAVAEPIQKKNLDPISAILEETRRSMTSGEYHNLVSGDAFEGIVGGTKVAPGTPVEQQPSVDLSMIPGIKNAKAILEAANEKSRNKGGIVENGL